MPSNVEIKARLDDFDVFHTLFKKVYQPKDGDLKTLEHCDTYFKCDNGRLKLREIKSGDESSAELIFYDRNDNRGPKLSDYVKHECSAQTDALKESLVRAYGKRGEVKKTRLLYVVEQTRVHIDKVAGIGQFMELEVMLRDGQTTADGQKVADEFMEKLNITDDMLVKGSYIDLLGAGGDAKENGASAKPGKKLEATKDGADDAEMKDDSAKAATNKSDEVVSNQENAAKDTKTES